MNAIGYTMKQYSTGRPPKPGRKRQLRKDIAVTGRRKKASSKPKKKKSSSSAWKSSQFVSVLSSPFTSWNDLEIVIGEYFPDWSLNHRSYIVQHLIRFLELKVLTEEFVTDRPLLAPTPLVALAWQAVILDAGLYVQTLHDIQEFHGRPRQLLKFSLERNEFRGKVDAERLQRTQLLFQSYYHEPMMESLQDADAEMSLADTSAITDQFLFRCGGPDEQNKLVKKSTSMKKRETKKNSKSSSWWSCTAGTFLDMVGDLLLPFDDFQDEGSQDETVLVDDIEEERPTVRFQDPEEIFRRDADGNTEYDSVFTFDFFHTRHLLCRKVTCQDDFDPQNTMYF